MAAPLAHAVHTRAANRPIPTRICQAEDWLSVSSRRGCSDMELNFTLNWSGQTLITGNCVGGLPHRQNAPISGRDEER